MSKCAYFSCFKGRPVCKHPTYGKEYSAYLHGAINNMCDWCKKQCGGIYPSQVPKVDQSNWTYDIIDKDGSLIN